MEAITCTPTDHISCDIWDIHIWMLLQLTVHLWTLGLHLYWWWFKYSSVLNIIFEERTFEVVNYFCGTEVCGVKVWFSSNTQKKRTKNEIFMAEVSSTGWVSRFWKLMLKHKCQEAGNFKCISWYYNNGLDTSPVEIMCE